MKPALLRGPINRIPTIWGFFTSLLGLPFCGPEKGEHILGSFQNSCGPEAPELFSSLLPPLLGEKYRLSDGTNK